MSLPNIVFVSERKDNDGTSYYVAETDVRACIEDDGPTLVGTYKLVATRKLAKTITDVKRRGGRGAG